MEDYRTIHGTATGEYEEKKSRFIAALSFADSEEAAVAFLEQVRAANRTARHNVYAYRLREGNRERYSDDGEPAKTAGTPALEVLQHSGLTDLIVVITRYFGGVLLGAGLGLILRGGATTGGTDIIGRLVHKAFPHIQIGKVIMAADALIVVLGAVVFRSVESAMYAVIVIFVNSRLLDYILYGTGSGKLLLAVTEHAQEISDAITSKMGRGITILPVKGGYTGKEKSMVVCAVKKNEVPHLTKIIRQVDTETFIIITEAGEILGEGFIAPGVN